MLEALLHVGRQYRRMGSGPQPVPGTRTTQGDDERAVARRPPASRAIATPRPAPPPRRRRSNRVLVPAAAGGLEVQLLQALGDGADATRAYRAVVHLDDGAIWKPVPERKTSSAA
jgi:hypothetical protein